MKKINKSAILPQGLPLRFFNNLIIFLFSYFILFLKVFSDFPSTHTTFLCVEAPYKEIELKMFFCLVYPKEIKRIIPLVSIKIYK